VEEAATIKAVEEETEDEIRDVMDMGVMIEDMGAMIEDAVSFG
jgi:hypothetical protein